MTSNPTACLPDQKNVRAQIARGDFPLKLDPLLALGEPGVRLAELFYAMEAEHPPTSVTTAVAIWLLRALDGEQSHILSVVCPDYAWRETGSPKRPVEYTFNGLGTGVGLVAQRFAKVTPLLGQFINAHGLNIRCVVPIADVEATPDCCARVGVTREEFLRRNRLSQECLQRECSKHVRIETPLLTEFFPHWEGVHAQAREAAQSMHLSGAFPLHEKDLRGICRAREGLLRRWHGPDVNVGRAVLAQAPDYMMVGALSSTLSNCLVLGCDAPAMAPFLQGLGTHIRPVLYLEAVHY